VALFPDPVASATLFATSSLGISKSVDSGQTWRLVYPFTQGYVAPLAIDPGNHLRVAALVGTGMIRSLDGGETWQPAGTLCTAYAQKLLAAPGVLLAGPCLSRDWGATFQTISPQGGIAVAAFDASHPGWIYAGSSAGVMGSFWLSTDYGATWTKKASPPTTFSGILNLAACPTL